MTQIPNHRKAGMLGFFLALSLGVASCSPTVKVQAPDKPIVINLNVKIEQEVRVRVDRDLDETAKKRPDLF